MEITIWQSIKQRIESAGIQIPVAARLVQDSRDVQHGDIFVALKGEHQNGNDFVLQALENGACAALVEHWDHHLASDDDYRVNIIRVEGLASTLAEILNEFYFSESAQITPLIGVTGTNGKSSIAHFLAQLSQQCPDRRLAIMGTLGHGHIDNLIEAKNTTPSITDVYYLLNQFGLSRMPKFYGTVMEVSSHALVQNRVQGLHFDVAIYTNLTHEHLDYHGSMDEYFQEKLKLFTEYQPKVSVVNFDDDYGKKLITHIQGMTRIVVIGSEPEVKSFAEYVYVHNIHCHAYGMSVDFDWNINGEVDSLQLQLPFYGAFNSANLASVFATAKILDWPINATMFTQLKPVPGRLESYVKPNLPIVIVDYAHTPAALEQVLESVKQHLSGRLYLIFGCGGERDRSKRPLMGEIAAKWADSIILTNDNPRNEPEEQIFSDIRKGLVGCEKYEVIADRKEAICSALLGAEHQDLVLIAGKGHETYQTFAKETVDYNEREFVKDLVQSLSRKINALDVQK